MGLTTGWGRVVTALRGSTTDVGLVLGLSSVVVVLGTHSAVSRVVVGGCGSDSRHTSLKSPSQVSRRPLFGSVDRIACRSALRAQAPTHHRTVKKRLGGHGAKS